MDGFPMTTMGFCRFFVFFFRLGMMEENQLREKKDIRRPILFGQPEMQFRNFQMTRLEVTNYRFRKSMGWEIKASLLYQAYVQISEGMGMFSDSEVLDLLSFDFLTLRLVCVGILLISICICILNAHIQKQ